MRVGFYFQNAFKVKTLFIFHFKFLSCNILTATFNLVLLFSFDLTGYADTAVGNRLKIKVKKKK